MLARPRHMGEHRHNSAAPAGRDKGERREGWGLNMGKYVDGFVVPVPKANLEAYRRMAEDAGKVWREYGALEFIECVADDVKPGEVTSFPQSVKLEPDETVVFAWIVYEFA